jgi:hypothetical protein
LRISDLHTNQARYELKKLILYLWSVNVKTIPGFFNVTLADFFIIILRHNNITININNVEKPRHYRIKTALMCI